MPTTSLTYVFDAYCGWCHGFGPALREFVAARADRIEVKVISGGLFLGGNRAPLGAMPHVEQANRRITDLTGATFGDGYRRLAEDGSFVMDSEAAAIGFAALRSEDPERALVLAGAMQHAFYVDGRSLSDASTYVEIAETNGLDADAVLARRDSADAAASAAADFARARDLGASSFPTLLVHTPTGVARLGGPTSTATQLSAALDHHDHATGISA